MNMGLLKGLKRSGGAVGASDVVDDGRDGSLGARARELFRLAPPGLADRVMTEFVSEHKEVLEALRVPWFMPERLGGVGLPAYWDSRNGTYRGPTMMDIRKGVDILLNHQHRLRRGRSAVWKTHALAMQRLPEMPEGGAALSEQERERAERVVGLLGVGCLLDSRVQLADLFDPNASSASNCLRANERVWARAVPVPMDVARRFRDTALAEAKAAEALPLVLEVNTGGV